jgi:hypothetical protein
VKVALRSFAAVAQTCASISPINQERQKALVEERSSPDAKAQHALHEERSKAGTTNSVASLRIRVRLIAQVE